MKVDKIIKNASVFTSAAVNFHASAFAVKDGKFVYVGDEEGLKDFEGEIVDLGGKFVMPGISDSHVHMAINTAFEYTPEIVPINGAKQLRLEKTKGSIEVGKDADYLVLKENLLTIPAEGMKNIVPEEVYFSGVKMN